MEAEGRQRDRDPVKVPGSGANWACIASRSRRQPFVEAAERPREAVAAMLAQGAAERSKSILDPRGQSYEALAPEHDMARSKPLKAGRKW